MQLVKSRYPETTTDAYDKLYAKLLDPKMNTLLRWLPGIGSWLQAILNYQLLLDRYVPQNTEVNPHDSCSVLWTDRDLAMPLLQLLCINQVPGNSIQEL